MVGDWKPGLSGMPAFGIWEVVRESWMEKSVETYNDVYAAVRIHRMLE